MYQNAQKENFVYNYNSTTPLGGYLGPHEMYPSAFPYQMMYPQQQCVKPPYNYSMPSEQREMYLPKTLPMPMEEPTPVNYPTALFDSRNLEGQNTPESFEVWNNSFSRDVKSIPKFDSLLDIDRLEQICYDDVDNCPVRSNAEKLKDSRNRRPNKDEKTVQSSMKDVLDGSFDRPTEKAAVGYGSFERTENTGVGCKSYERTSDKAAVASSKIMNKPSSSSPNGARPKDFITANGKPVKQSGNSVKVNIYSKCDMFNKHD